MVQREGKVGEGVEVRDRSFVISEGKDIKTVKLLYYI